jgi:hypothetical protein
MKLKEFIIESAISEIRKSFTQELFEDVNQYLALTLAKLKNKKPEEAFKTGDPHAIDLDHLSQVIIAMKVLGNSDHRSALTKNEVGFTPADSKELFKFLSDVAKDGNDPQYVKKAFAVIAKLTPTAIKKQTAELQKLKDGSDAERSEVIRNLEQFMHKVSQYYGKLRSAGTKSTSVQDVKTLGTV